MTVSQLRKKYLEVFGEDTRSNHKQFLYRRIAWRIQALAEGGLSERARRRALEIANDADLRIRAPKTKFGTDTTMDPRLSVTSKVAGRTRLAGCRRPDRMLDREYKGQHIIVKVLVDGFEFEGRAVPVAQRHRPRGHGHQMEWLPLLQSGADGGGRHGKK